MVRKKKLVLSFPEIVELGSTGKCKIKFESGYLVGSTYEIAKFSGYWARVESKTSSYMGLSLIEMPKEQPRGRSRKVELLKIQSQGAFIGKKEKYELDELVSIAEAYSVIYERLMQEDKAIGVEFLHRIADVHRVDVEQVKSLTGWHNASKVRAELMTRRIRIVEAFSARAREIVPAVWDEIGLKWLSEEFELQKKKQYIGWAKWNGNGNVIIYRYSLIEG